MKYQELRDAANSASRLFMGGSIDRYIAMMINAEAKLEKDIVTIKPSSLRALLAELDAKTEALASLADDIDGLTGESDGVAGLHLNGDIAPWDDLLPSGRFERLTSLDAARAALSQGEKT